MDKLKHSALEIYREHRLDDMFLVYRGFISDELTSTFLDISENTVVDALGLTKVNRKASFLLVECFQNMLKHTHSEHIEAREHADALFHFRFHPDYFRINSINTISRAEEAGLRSAVEEINALDAESLKALYKDRLVANKLSDKGGAGLGLIEMARKSGQKLHYDFRPIDGDRSAFWQQITMAHSGYDAALDTLDNLERMQANVEAEDVVLIYKGDLSQKAILPLILLLEKNTDGNALLSKRAGITMIEMLQNASKHGLNRGVLKLYRVEGKMVIEVGNTLELTQGQALVKRLEVLHNMSEDELKEAYRNHLRNVRNLEQQTNSGLGLMEIARLSGGAFDFDLQPEDGAGFFTFRVTL